MVYYRRATVPGATYFFTVTLRDRRPRLLIDQITAFREALQTTKRARPFRIDTMAVLPGRVPAIWALPPWGSRIPLRSIQATISPSRLRFLPDPSGRRVRPHGRIDCCTSNRGKVNPRTGALARISDTGAGHAPTPDDGLRPGGLHLSYGGLKASEAPLLARPSGAICWASHLCSMACRRHELL